MVKRSFMAPTSIPKMPKTTREDKFFKKSGGGLGAGSDFGISNSPSKMTKPEVLGILGLDVGDNWAQGCLLESCRLCLDHMLAI